MSTSAKNQIVRQQRRWASATGRKCDARGFVARLDDNLRLPPAARTLAELDRPGSSELKPGRTQPPRIYALHSSAALVVNVFEHWCGRDLAPLLRALGLPGVGRRLTFERPFGTGLPGDPPYIDVALELASGNVVAIESKFTEWLTPRPPRQGGFKPKYFCAAARHWAECALPRCQSLAEDLQARKERFKHLHAAQLLKHALGLARQQRAVSLYYLYYDVAGPESRAHRAEIARFLARLAPEIAIAALTYQELYGRLRGDERVDRGYLDYLRERYFSTVG